MPRAKLRLLIGLGVALVAVVVGVVVLSGDDDDLTGSAPALGDTCRSVHEGHNAMSWDPVQADEMVDADCGWPYEPFLVSDGGGEDDPSLDSPFEPRRYGELSDVIAAADLGLCGVQGIPKDGDEGLVFGFRYQAAEPGCPDVEPTVELTAREYVTEARRDGAAGEAEGEVLVLGRWVLDVVGSDDGHVSSVVEGLVAIGAEPVAP